VSWGRVVSVRGSFGFLQPIGGGGATSDDIFFRAADVTGMNSTDPGEEGCGLQIVLPHGRNSHGYKTFWLAPDDEVSFISGKDQKGKPCAVDVFKEKKGAWRSGRRTLTGPRGALPRKETIKDHVKRLSEMDADEVLQNVSLFKDVLDSNDVEAQHLYKIVAILGSREIAEDMRSDSLYRLFLDSKIMQTTLRTTIIKQSAGKHSGTFLEECLSLIVELVLRASAPSELRFKLPLTEIVEAWEQNVKEGSSSTRKGLPEDVAQQLLCLQKHFPDEVKLDRVMGTRAPKVQRSAAEEFTELLQADYYQDMPILPTSAEMLGQCAFEIEQNMRTYDKCDDYIQTHFMLLREDYIEPLRAGIKLFMQGRHSPKDLHVYTGIKVVGILSTWEGVVYRIELQKSETKRINWEKTKQLMFGSLLCLSADNFQTLIWATVWRRDEHLIATEAQLDVRLPFEPFDDRLAPGKVFCCIENVTIYFEAYRHVLIALQNMKPSDMPFHDTLLSPQPEPHPPSFLKAESDMFHFHNVFESCLKADSEVQAPKSFKVLQKWPESLQKALDIDPSQLDAIHHALTHQMALIQGPPGTGKTWVGLKIVQALLDNTGSCRHSPMLVVCYTNHALDQFLEGIFRFCERIARIGSRSKSEAMKARNLKELVSEVPASREYLHARRGLNERRDKLREELAQLVRDVDKHVLEFYDIKGIMKEEEFLRFWRGYLEYLGDDAKKLPLDPDQVDDEEWDKGLWESMMKAWLETNSDLSKLAPVISKAAGGLPPPSAVAGLEDEDSGDEGQAKDKDKDKDQEEEEADHEQHDRKLDVEQKEVKQTGDFCADLKNAWLPYWEEHVETLGADQRNLNWHEEDLWCLPLSLKRETYKQWLLEAHHEAREMLPEISRQLERNALHRAALERDRKLKVLREMDFVGMTTTAVSKYQVLLKELRPEVVIVEEAAEVLEAHVLTALHPRTQHVVLIGDHQQLRPSTAVYRLSKHFNLDISLFERLIKNGCDHVTLLQQRRMHPKISRLIRPLYPELRDHKSTLDYPEIMGVDARCFFMSHNHYEDDEGESHSKANSFEANFIGALVAHLVKSGYDESQITVLSPYLGQVRLLKNKLRRDPTTTNVAITAVDNFQGEENDIIIISLVRSNRTKSMGFLAVDNRINVALTRAKHGMFIVGNSDMLRGHQLWGSIINELWTDYCINDRMPLLEMDTNLRIEVKTPDDIAVLLDDPLHETGAEVTAFDDGRGPRQVAERWANLGRDDRDGGKGRQRGQRGGDQRDRDRGFGGKAGGKGRGEDDRGFDERGSRRRGGKDRDKGGKGRPDDDRRSDDRGPGPDARPFEDSDRRYTRSQASGGSGGAGAREESPQDRAPPPPKMEADGVHDECELMPQKGEEGDEDGQKRGGKKSKQKGNKVVMRWG